MSSAGNDTDEESSYFNKPFKNISKRGKKAMAAPQARKALDQPASTAASSAPFRIVTGVQQAQRFLKIFLYAKYGHGKTVLAAQAADVPKEVFDMGDVLFINVEGGTQSIMGARHKDGTQVVRNHKRIDFVPEEGTLASFEMFDAIHRMLLAYCQARDDDDDERLARMADKYGFPALRTRNWRTIIIDSLSELNSISLARAFGENTSDLLTLADSDDTRRDYGRNRQSMTKVLRAFRNLPMNVIVTCGADWERNDKDKDMRPKYYPRLTGALSQEVQGYWDVVGFLYSPGRDENATEEEQGISSRLYLQPGKFHDAKNRLAGRDVRWLDNPSMTRLISLLTTGEVAVEKAPAVKDRERDRERDREPPRTNGKEKEERRPSNNR
jgi:AAA domain